MHTNRTPTIVVVGSINLDLAARVARLPRAGETVSDAELGRHPGGKGANQALAARRLGADVTMLGRVGADAMAGEALRLLREDGVMLEYCSVDAELPTGIALIAVDGSGENQIVVAPGANRRLSLNDTVLPQADALICQLEVPVKTLLQAAERYNGFFCINLAPAIDVPGDLLSRADLIVVNEHEAAFYGQRLRAAGGLLAITQGARGAQLFRDDELLAEAAPPQVDTVDATGAGDTFTAGITLALIEGRAPADALAFACAAAALATSAHGAQPSLPRRSNVDALLGNWGQ